MWDRSHPNRRYPTKIRDSKLNEILHRESWIIEGVHHKWGHESFKRADLIYIIKPNKIQRDYRVIRRFIRTRLGLEQSNYRQTYKDLYQMLFVWNREFDKDSIKEIIEMTGVYSEKRIIVRTNKQLLKQTEQFWEVTQESNDFI
ncbi:DNA topology modulation protein FlaR [Saccharibacillus kuerlensis]|uniref:DNA topology modulation protein FlaR n=2 Tax=Saccharibacillus kuerlensis TaxID=459527 RepID=A0ABQ2L397_9BACL|nr:DNA topology modulation protein FlaR [Saccharibacillus kuerlensis]